MRQVTTSKVKLGWLFGTTPPLLVTPDPSRPCSFRMTPCQSTTQLHFQSPLPRISPSQTFSGLAQKSWICYTNVHDHRPLWKLGDDNRGSPEWSQRERTWEWERANSAVSKFLLFKQNKMEQGCTTTTEGKEKNSVNFRPQPQLSHPIFQHCVCTAPCPMSHHLSVKPNILYMLQGDSQMFVLSLCKSRPRMEGRKRRSDIHILLCTTMLRKYFWGSAYRLLSVLSIVVFLLAGVMYDDGDWKQNKTNHRPVKGKVNLNRRAAWQSG